MSLKKRSIKLYSMSFHTTTRVGMNTLILCGITFLLCDGAEVKGMPESEKNDMYYRSSLHKNLFKNYTQMVRPSFNESTPVDVTMYFALIRLNNLWLSHDVHDIKFHVILMWYDSRLSWNSSMYGRINWVTVSANKIWMPDITIYNSYASYAQRNKVVRLFSSGFVTHYRELRILSHCQFDVTRFPYDSQLCDLEFGSSNYNAMEVNIHAYDKFFASHFKTNKAWKLAKHTLKRNVVKYECCTELYVTHQLNVTWERRYNMASYLLVLPASFIALLVPFIFLLPPESKYKILISGIVIMSQMTLEITMKYFLPTQAKNPPLISVYYMMTTGLASMALVISVLVINMCDRGPRTNRVPDIIQRLLVGNKRCLFFPDEIGVDWLDKAEVGMRGLENPILSTAEGVACFHTVPEKDVEPVHKQVAILLAHSRKDEIIVNTENEWKLFAMFIDRACFVTYVIIYITAAICLFS